MHRLNASLTRPTARLLLVIALVAGCSNGSSSGDAAPLWPDLVLDRALPDHPAPPDQTPLDLPAQDFRFEGGGSPWHTATVGAQDLHAVTCLAAGHVFVAGDKGTLLHHAPTAPGASLVKQAVGDSTAPEQADLYTVAFADASYGVTAGKDWRIWETRDQGASWVVAPQCSAFVFETFHALHLWAANAGFGAGVAINSAGAGYKYYGGYSWVCGPSLYPNEVFLDVVRQDQLGWIVGSTGGKIYHTTNEGGTWVGYAAGTSETLRGVAIHGSVGVAVGDKGTIVTSSDGKWWSAATSPVTVDLYGVTLFNASDGWAVGDGGTLLRTSDGGQSWTPQVSGVSQRLESICFTSATNGWAVGQGGTVLHTTTGGL